MGLIHGSTAKQYREALSEAGLLAGSAHDLPPLETLKAVILL
jgi:hypothetical protein